MCKLKNPKVSILISNYNKDLYLKKSLTSCVLQSYKNKEIIIYDDCSTDNSVRIIKKFKKIKKIYKIKRSSKSNPVNQINALRNCFKHSTGDIIFFWIVMIILKKINYLILLENLKKIIS